MTGNKLTHREHAARAMLMGRIYDWRDGTYCLPNPIILGEVTTDDMIDAMTLEPVSASEANRRVREWGTRYGISTEPKPTPYGEGEL